jgi:AcrR family transcriptional regulator/DNA-binding MarR family transcriptional regulator
VSSARDRRRLGSSPPRARSVARRRPVREVAGREGAIQISEVQRARILFAAAEIVGEVGFAGMSVARVTACAGVSRRTFYDLFEDREDCFMAVFEDAVVRATVVATRAAEGHSGWREQVRAGLSGLLRFAGDERVLGALLVVHALGSGPNVLSCRARRLGPLIAFIDQGRSQTKTGKEGPPPLTAEGVVGAVLSVIHGRMLERPDEPLIDLLNPLMGMIVLPYLGPAAAAKEMARPVPKVRSAPRKLTKDPLDGLRMRLTYRTLRVLAAIADQGGRGSGPSNRAVADLAGVQDQGQISKLLARLEHLGLIANTGSAHAKGEANSWTLTDKGQEVERAIRIDSGRPTS